MAPGSQGQGGRESTLQIDAEAVPILRSAFVDALAKIDRQLELAEKELRVTAWSGDPVSRDATKAFNERSVDGAQSAIDALRAYRTQLEVAVVTLEKTAEQYRETDGDGQVGVNRTGGAQ